jgi:hypothetical protein
MPAASVIDARARLAAWNVPRRRRRPTTGVLPFDSGLLMYFSATSTLRRRRRQAVMQRCIRRRRIIRDAAMRRTEAR